MEHPQERDPATESLVDKVRDDLDSAEASDDENRLEALEGIRRELETELDSSLENDTSRH